MTKEKETKSSDSQQKKWPDRLVYVGPTISEFMLVFGKIYKEITRIPGEFKQLKLERFFVRLEEYTKKKRELLKEHNTVLKAYREIKRELRKEANR